MIFKINQKKDTITFEKDNLYLFLKLLDFTEKEIEIIKFIYSKSLQVNKELISSTTQEQIKNELKSSPTTITKAIKKLINNNLCEIKKGRRMSLYKLVEIRKIKIIK
jgi:DNA-binding MarR family transcriptional regulator